ncbi:DUF2591 domain-containing protein [Paraburkholderia sp. CNPSo 3157]|uniref:DUF2591 domain-containing protein n=1 Tax=Paraburkholderia franconis TaxID=2654983 RepID=A0A7X1NC66_9BURK|nr:DUF2591 domain-containing protein [Paraburkholderia franconis]MPW19159.1 DUF2591 domain-containing protein [Paraburkholderia franconis]
MRVSDLEGALLDYWVARADNLPKPRVDDGFCWIEEPACDGDPEGALEAVFAPSTDWAQCGPIIERARIHLVPAAAGEHATWTGFVPAGTGTIEQTGATPLTAAMRAFVARHFGDTVADQSNTA